MLAGEASSWIVTQVGLATSIAVKVTYAQFALHSTEPTICTVSASATCERTERTTSLGVSCVELPSSSSAPCCNSAADGIEMMALSSIGLVESLSEAVNSLTSDTPDSAARSPVGPSCIACVAVESDE